MPEPLPQIFPPAQPYRASLIAVASNEAAYIAEWIFHHLYFGFGPIEILVNRSTDATEAIARAIAVHYPDVRVSNCDYFDASVQPVKCIQYSAYGRARQRLRAELARDDYMMFLDIDEFWTPTDLASPVQEVLRNAGRPGLAAFNWLLINSDTKPFASTITSVLAGAHHTNLKMAFRARMAILARTPHGVVPLWPTPVWVASGAKMGWRRRYATLARPEAFGPAFIAHRYFRSQLEYLALLGRGRPKKRGLAFKDNRYGYHAGCKSGAHLATFEPPKRAWDTYCDAYARFRTKVGAEDYLSEAQETVRARARHVLATYLGMPPLERDMWRVPFRGLDLDALSRQLGLAAKFEA